MGRSIEVEEGQENFENLLVVKESEQKLEALVENEGYKHPAFASKWLRMRIPDGLWTVAPSSGAIGRSAAATWLKS